MPHFQVVFTLPGVLRELAQDNPGVVYGAMFVAAADTLRTLGEQRLGVRLGVLEVLHTWNRELLLHPHINCLVTAGGLTPEGAWQPSRSRFLFPQRVMAAMYRGKVVEALRNAHADGNLGLRSAAPDALASLLAKAHRHRWVVHVEPPDDRPVEHAAEYLAKVVAGGPISDERILANTNAKVTFRGRDKVVTVDGHEFIRRFTLHFLPPRFKRTRCYGLYSNTSHPPRRWSGAPPRPAEGHSQPQSKGVQGRWTAWSTLGGSTWPTTPLHNPDPHPQSTPTNGRMAPRRRTHAALAG